MNHRRTPPVLFLAFVTAVLLWPPTARAQSSSVTIRAARVLDGRGAVLSNATVEVRDAKIVAVDQRMGPVDASAATTLVDAGSREYDMLSSPHGSALLWRGLRPSERRRPVAEIGLGPTP